MIATWNYNSFYQNRSKFGPYRACFVTRHPLDRYISSYRYHLDSKEYWLKLKFWNNETNSSVSHQSYLKTLSRSDGILFEMSEMNYHKSDAVVSSMNDPDCFIHHLEEFRVNPTEVIANLSSNLNISSSIVNKCFHEKAEFQKQSRSSHSTVALSEVARLTHEKYEFVGQLECIHYQYFEQYSGGLAHIIALGYHDSLSVYKAEKERTCSDVDVKNMFFPSFPPLYNRTSNLYNLER